MGRVCRQKGRRDPLLAAWQAGSPEPWPKILPRASKEEWPARENNLKKSLLVFLPERLRGSQQFSVFLNGLFKQRRLFARQFPILLFDGFGEPREFQVRVGVARRIEKMLKPRPARNPGRIEPIRFYLQELFIQPPNFFRRERTRLKIASDRVAQKVACFFELSDASVKPFQREMPLLDIIVLLEFAQKLFQRRCVETEIKRKNVRVSKTERHEPPHPRESDVVFERRVTDMRHPVMIVVHRVIDAVVARETQVDNRAAEGIVEHSVIGAAANT